MISAARLLPLVVLGLSAPPAAAPDSPPTPAPAAAFTPWANKFFQKDPPPVLVHDFGTVPKGTLLVHKMTITNIYDVPMQIIDVRKSCACLNTTPPPQVLQPHDTATLTLLMNADKFSGPNSQSFFVTFGPQFVSTAVIQVKAVSRADVTLTPGQVNFGTVAVGGTPVQSVAVKYHGKQKDWTVTGVRKPAGPFTAEVTNAGKDEFRLTVTLNADAPAGLLNEPVILTTNDPAAASVPVNVSAVVQAAVTVSPGTVRFSDVKLGTTATQKVVVRAVKPFRIAPPADTADGFAAEVFPAAAPVQIVTVTFKPAAAGTFRKTITLQTDLGPAEVPIEAVVVP